MNKYNFYFKINTEKRDELLHSTLQNYSPFTRSYLAKSELATALNYLFSMIYFNFFLDSCKSALGFYESQSVTIDLFHNVHILGLRLFGTLPIAIGYFRRLERSSVFE